VPAWAAPFADGASVQRALAGVWQPLDAGWLAANATTRDDQEGEGDYLGLGAAFPHRATSVKALRATPGGDGLVLELARRAAAHAVETVGRTFVTPAEAARRPVLLSLSLSSNDYIDHVFGPDSWEAWDELRRLDRGLGELFEALDALVGARGWAVMVTGDHGSNPLPELSRTGRPVRCRRAGGDHWQRPCGRGGRLMASEIARGLDDGRGLVAGVVDPFIYLTPRGRALPPDERAALQRRIDALFAGKGEVAQVIDVRTAPDVCPPASDESLPALTCRSIRRDQAGDFYIVPAPGYFFDPELAVGHGTSHGSPYLYDRTVPLLVRAPGRVSPGVTRREPTSYAAFARTGAALLGIPEPSGLAGSDAPDLTSAHY
jgi:hypothetical protein